MVKRAMSSEKASQVKLRGHEKEKIFAKYIGLDDEYKNDRKAKKDVIDFNGDGHSIKSGTWWQLFLYSFGRIKGDYGFLTMNGIGQLLLDCLAVFPENRKDYLANKDLYKNKLKIPMRELCEKFQDKNRLKAFLSKAIFNGGEVQFLSVFDKDGFVHIFHFEDVVDVLANSLSVENSKAKNIRQYDDQKLLFKKEVNIGEIEIRNDSEQHYKEIKFRLNGMKTLQILKENIADYDKPDFINKTKNETIYRYAKAMKKFKT